MKKYFNPYLIANQLKKLRLNNNINLKIKYFNKEMYNLCQKISMQLFIKVLQ